MVAFKISVDTNKTLALTPALSPRRGRTIARAGKWQYLQTATCNLQRRPLAILDHSSPRTGHPPYFVRPILRHVPPARMVSTETNRRALRMDISVTKHQQLRPVRHNDNRPNGNRHRGQ